jgi:hypothetical protein
MTNQYIPQGVFKQVTITGICWLLAWMWAAGLLALILFSFNQTGGKIVVFTFCEIAVLVTAHWVISRTC